MGETYLKEVRQVKMVARFKCLRILIYWLKVKFDNLLSCLFGILQGEKDISVTLCGAGCQGKLQ